MTKHVLVLICVAACGDNRTAGPDAGNPGDDAAPNNPRAVVVSGLVLDAYDFVSARERAVRPEFRMMNAERLGHRVRSDVHAHAVHRPHLVPGEHR